MTAPFAPWTRRDGGGAIDWTRWSDDAETTSPPMPRWFADWAVATYDDDYWQRRPQGPIQARVIECERARAA